MIDFSEIIKRVQQVHPDLSDDDIKEICEMFLQSFGTKAKEEIIIKNLNKYVDKEFGLNDLNKDIKQEQSAIDKVDNGTQSTVKTYKKFDLEMIPKYLFSGTSKINDCLINLSGLYKSIGKTDLFEDAQLKVNPTDKIALIGRNGAGKSTLLKMLIGVEEMDAGIMNMNKKVKIGYLSQELFWESKYEILGEHMLSVFPDISKDMHRLEEIKDLIGAGDADSVNLVHEQDDIVARLGLNDGYRKYDLQLTILSYFGFTKDQLKMPVGKLSGGEQTKVQIAKFLIQDVDLLILDEPTNHLDIEGIMFLEKFCKLWGKALICISHDKKFIDNVFDRIIEISNKKINLYVGNYNDYIEKKAQNYDNDLKDYENQQKELDKQNKYIERFRYKASKAASVQSRIKALDKIEKLEPPTDESKVRDIKVGVDIRLPNLIMRLEGLDVGYNESLISLPKLLEVTKDQKIGIIGKNGAGKTTLLKTILGEMKPLSGTTFINEIIRVGSYSQVLEELNLDNIVLDELMVPGVSQKEVRAILGGLLIDADKVEQRIRTLSGGEKAKVALTKMLLVKPHIIIMDEPTNHLDLYSKEAIKNMLMNFNGMSLVVSHDRDLLESIVNKLWVVKDRQLNVFDSIDRGFEEMY